MINMEDAPFHILTSGNWMRLGTEAKNQCGGTRKWTQEGWGGVSLKTEPTTKAIYSSKVHSLRRKKKAEGKNN